MATGAPSWADQWGTGGFGAMDIEESHDIKKENDSKKKGSVGLGKAKAVALARAQKMKNGTSMGIKWVKSKCQKKTPSSS